MRSSLRTAVGAVLTTAVVLSVPGVSLAAPTPATSRDAASAEAAPGVPQYSPAEATAIFNKLQAALAPKRLAPRKLGNPLPRKDLSLLMRDAQAARGSMSARQASIIDNANLGNRPVSDGNGCTQPFLSPWSVVESAHFCVHYKAGSSAGQGGATLTQATNTINAMEYVYTKEVAGLGYEPPLLDSDSLYDVFLDQLGDQGYYGFCTTESGSATSTAWCGLDNDFAVAEFGAPPANSLKVTAAHEFFHAIQFAYDAFEDDWFMEGTAVWAEEQVYPTINDYLQYLPSSQLVRPTRSADINSGLSVYGSVIFWKFLAERYQSPTVIRQIWNSARVSAGSRQSIAAVGAVLKSKGSTLALEFARYGVWNTLPPKTYADRSLFPAPGAWAAGTLSRRSRDTGVLSVKLNHLATAPLVLRTSTSLPTRTKLIVTVDGPNTSHSTQARIQLRYKSGKVTYYVISLNASGYGTKVVPFNPAYLKSAIVTMSNGSGGYNDQTFKIRARVKY